MTSTSKWAEKPVLKWTTILGIVLISFAVIGVFKVASALMPEPEKVLKPQEVTIGDSSGWHMTLHDTSGNNLSCVPASAVFLSGWDCDGTRIMAHHFPTPDDPALAIRRIIRAANLSDLPKGDVESTGNVTVVTLNAEENAAITSHPANGNVTTGLLVANPQGSNGESFVITIEGKPDTVKALSEQITAEASK